MKWDVAMRKRKEEIGWKTKRKVLRRKDRRKESWMDHRWKDGGN